MLLKVGSRGEEVEKLQQKLGVDSDGIFGPQTEAAVKSWQAANNLAVDGLVGKQTWGKLFPVVADEQAAPTNAETVALDTRLLDKLKPSVPTAVIEQISSCAEKFEINTNLRLAHFLAQCAYESADFKVTEENLNYSAVGLQKVFNKYFPGDLAGSYARQPEKIASRVYANRMGNGDEASK